MKIILTTIILVTIALTGYSQDPAQIKQDKQKPKATYQVGSAKVTVWVNKNSDGTSWKNFTVEKEFRKGGKWVKSNHFNETQLLELKAAIDKAISEESVKTK